MTKSQVSRGEARVHQGLGAPGVNALLDGVLDPLVLLMPRRDARGRIHDYDVAGANQPAADFLRVERSELLTRTMLESFPALRGTEILKILSSVARGRGPYLSDDVELLSVRTGALGHFEVRATLVDGHVALTWRDVTTRREILEGYRLLAENASDVVVRFDPHGTLEWVSPSVSHELGYSPNELLGHYLAGIVHPDDEGPLITAIDALVGTDHGTFEARLRHQDGEYHHFAITVHSVRDQGGAVSTHIASLHRIDTEVAQRQAVTEERDVLRSTLEAGLDPKIVCWAVVAGDREDPDLIITEANRAALDYWGLDREAVVGRTVVEFLSHLVDTELYRAVVRAARSTEAIDLVDVPVTNREGKPAWYDLRCHRLGELVTVTWRDVTERH